MRAIAIEEAEEFASLPALIGAHAARRPAHLALIVEERRISYGELESATARVAAALQRDGVKRGDRVATLGGTSVEHLLAFLGALRAGAAVAPLPALATAEQLHRMLSDVRPMHLFIDAPFQAVAASAAACSVVFDQQIFASWSDCAHAVAPIAIEPNLSCNIIYSSGTTGAPKGVVQPHRLRWGQIKRGLANGFSEDAVMLLATPLCSNTTLTGLFSVLGAGGTAVFMKKFAAGNYMECAARVRATHTALVPIQFKRILEHADFSRHDLSCFRIKIGTGAPLSVQLKREILERWPGALHEYYGLTEGGVFSLLDASAHPDKLHTVGKPPPAFDVRILNEQGTFAAAGEVGEIIGHSPLMMDEYFGQPQKTAEIEWFAADGTRYLRSGDLGRFDADGFLELMGRRKEMIISGGFNIYPKDLEDRVAAHSDVAEVAVAGVPSERWGETPVAWVVTKPGSSLQAGELLAWSNAELGATQRLGDLRIVAALPRNAMDKVVKAELVKHYPVT